MIFKNAKKIKTPLTPKVVKNLRAGQWVLLSGEIYTGRDQAHRRLFDLIEHGYRLPIPLKNEIIYYVGPTPARPGKAIGSAGPTTSSRMDKFTPRLMALGLLATMGKGERSQEVREAVKKYGGVYLVAVGGAGAYLSERIKKAELVAWPDLRAEAIYRLTVEDFPCLVAYDAKGGDVFVKNRKKFEEA